MSSPLLLAAAALRQLADALDVMATQPTPAAPPAMLSAEVSWRERLWTCDPQVRIGVPELSEGVDRPKSWVYRAVRGNGTCPPLPHRRLDGQLVFLAGEVRTWITEHEETVVAGRTVPLVVGRGR